MMSSRDEYYLRSIEQIMDGAWGKSTPAQEDKHAQRGGCGDPNCATCYDQNTGELNDPSGKYGGITGSDAMSTNATAGRWGAPPSPQRDREPGRLQQYRAAVQQWLIPADPKVTWDSVIGNPRAKEELQDAIEASVKHKELYQFYGMKAPGGICLSGPPGCGKTMFAKASAAAMSKLYGADVELLLIQGSEIESPILSIAGGRVTSIFNFAREYEAYYRRPLVIFIDEADALLGSRERAPWTQEVVSAFLNGMDGLKKNGAFIILATNRPDALDQALLRDGRIDLKIKVERPTLESAKQIAYNAMFNSKGFKTPDTSWVDDLFSYEYVLEEMVNPVTKHTHMFTLGHIVSGAMIVGMTERAKRIAFRRDREAKTMTGVTADDFKIALGQLFVESKAINHDYAVKEFILEIALPAEAELERRKMN
jgi:SpoVK/Ycf46/Vps4 family AAA+-type ATPase